MTDLYRLLPEEMEELVIELGQPRYRADQILYALYYKFPKNISEVKQLPAAFQMKRLASTSSKSAYNWMKSSSFSKRHLIA